jgi:hypothetical protein
VKRVFRSRDGYLRVDLFGRRKRYARLQVHRAVLEAFVGPCPSGMEACHNDGDSSNNHLDNLRWDTPQSNEADKLRHGTYYSGSRSCGEQNAAAKLTETDVLKIYELRRQGWKQKDLAKLFGIDRSHVCAILHGRVWKEVMLKWRAAEEE